MGLVAITCALRRGVTHVGEFNYWALLTLSREKLFQVLKTHLGMGRIRGLRGEEMAHISYSLEVAQYMFDSILMSLGWR